MLELHSILDPSTGEQMEQGTSTDTNNKLGRSQVIFNNLEKWKKIYDQFKFDIIYTDNSDIKLYIPFLFKLDKHLSFTNSWMNHWNKNPMSSFF